VIGRIVGGSSGGSIGRVVHQMSGSQNVMVGGIEGRSIGGRVGGIR
jgi:hypothetical protein